MAAARGRPTVYDADTAAEICRRMANGEGVSEICRTEGMPPATTVRMWVVDDREGFAAMYARAREAQAERWSEEIVEISDDGTNDWMTRNVGEDTVVLADHEHIQRSKLRVDARKWLMSKMAPKRYADRVEVTGKDGKDLIPAETDQSRLALALLNIIVGTPESEPEAPDPPPMIERGR